MKKSELKKIIKEEVKIILKEEDVSNDVKKYIEDDFSNKKVVEEAFYESGDISYEIGDTININGHIYSPGKIKKYRYNDDKLHILTLIHRIDERVNGTKPTFMFNIFINLIPSYTITSDHKMYSEIEIDYNEFEEDSIKKLW